ncbi:Hypothetical_protein [Hexamita inflata]|uniref:Hypothetical_protein n=1 Tax=Hexamita inflata TaxID=28002 RepID=A0AA86TU70_9EUKA|nr:Hypothetical protein HINF_LOCUS14822 [Hexamita inflata]
MNVIDQQIIQFIASQLKLEYSYDIEYQIVQMVQALPDQLYARLFVKLSFELNIEYKQLQSHFIANIAPKYNSIQQHRTQSLSHVQFKQRFTQALKTVMSSYFCECTINFDDNAHLCQCVNEYFKINGQMDFWVKMSKLIPQKNERQLREYYQKSFQRCMYLECITEPDKALLCKLIDQMPQSKPAVIADQFTKMVGTKKYFKRNVVMYVVNRKQK